MKKYSLNNISWKNFIVFLFSILIFFLMSPFLVWSIEYIIVVLFFIVFLLSLIFHKPNLIVDKKYFLFSIFFVLMIFNMVIPYRDYDEGVSYRHVLLLIIIFYYLFYLRNFTPKIHSYLKKILVFISFSSLVSYVFFILDLPFNSYQIQQDFRYEETNYYYLYYGMLVLNNQIYNIGGLDLLRNVGWFAEPGHFGTYICLFLALEEKIFNKKSNWILLIAALTTFSAVAYLYLAIIIFVRYFSIKGLVVLLSTTLLIGFVIYYNFNLFDYLILSKFNDDEILDARSDIPQGYFNSDIYRLFTGYGKYVLESNNFLVSDYRAMIYRYGFISVFFFIISLFFALIYGSNRQNLLIILIFSLIIFMHRVWMIDTLYYYFFMIFSIMLSTKHKVNI